MFTEHAHNARGTSVCKHTCRHMPYTHCNNFMVKSKINDKKTMKIMLAEKEEKKQQLVVTV